MTALTAIGTSLALVLLSVAIQVRLSRLRRKRLAGLELRSNCLLTRYPIVFINGKKSLFRLFSHWNDVPTYLREHGYDVYVLDPVSGKGATDSIVSALDSLGTKCHLVADSSRESELIATAQTKHPHIVSLTLVKNTFRQHDRRTQIRVDDLRPLGHAIEVFDVSFSHPETRPSLADLRLSSRILLFCHNLLHRQSPVDPLETAELTRMRESWLLENRFLDLAISLAERDTQWCD